MLRWSKKQKVFVKIYLTTCGSNGSVTKTILHLEMIVMGPRVDTAEVMVQDMGQVMGVDMALIIVGDMQATIQAMDQDHQQMPLKVQQLLQGQVQLWTLAVNKTTLHNGQHTFNRILKWPTITLLNNSSNINKQFLEQPVQQGHLVLQTTLLHHRHLQASRRASKMPNSWSRLLIDLIPGHKPWYVMIKY